MQVTHHMQQIRFMFSGFLVAILASIFLIGVAVYTASPNVLALIARMQSDALYTLMYRLPGSSAVASVAMAKGNAQAVPVLLYHGDGTSSNMPSGVFLDQMKSLKADGWHTISLAQFQDFIKKGKPVPAKSFLLTYDDGRKDTFYNADPVLKDLGFTGVMFVITGASLPLNGQKSSYYLNPQELEYMSQSGRWELQSHGDHDHGLFLVPGSTSTEPSSHFLGNKFFGKNGTGIETDTEYVARVTKDLTDSKVLLEKRFGKPITAFAFPFSDYGQNETNFSGARDLLYTAVQKQYQVAFYQIPSNREDIFNYPDPKALMIKRIEPTAEISGKSLVSLLNNAAPKTLPYHTQTFGTDWISNWGTAEPQATNLFIHATPNTTGGATLLAGSELWKNYRLTAQIEWESADDISLIARYKSDSETFVSCVYSKNTIIIQVHKNSEPTTVETKSYVAPRDKSNATISMTVSGGNVTCGAQGGEVTTKLSDSYVHTGQLGIQVWNEHLGVAQLHVKAISVDTI